MTDLSDEELADRLADEFDGWEDRVENPQHYHGWPVQAAHLHTRYDIAKMRACVVALKQEGAANKTIAQILDRGESTVSEHFSAFRERLQTSEDLRDVMGPHPWPEYEGFDPNMWLPITSVTYEYADADIDERTLKLFHERVGNAVENEYLIVDRKVEATDYAGETRTTITRSAVSGSETAIDKLTRSFRRDEDTVGHLALVYNGFFDPKGAPPHYTPMRRDRIQTVAEEHLIEMPDYFAEVLANDAYWDT